MLVTGDVALWTCDNFSFEGFPLRLYDIPMCINLEGAIDTACSKYPSGVFNCSSAFDSFNRFKVSHPFVANNHIHDIPSGLRNTRDYFKSKGLRLIGDTFDTNATVFESGNYTYAVLGFGWPVIGCVKGENGDGVNPFNRSNVINQVENALANFPNARIVVIIHGNYEFEYYPQPGHRKLSLELIDLGVYAVIFHHPHIIGPVERYKGRTIAYSLGNFAFSYGKFFDGRLSFPERTFHQIFLELGDEDLVHHCRFVPPSRVVYERHENVNSKDFTLTAEFEGFSEDDYIEFFKKKRHKNKGLPIYISTDIGLKNSIKDFFVFFRQKLINLSVFLGLKSLKQR